MLEPLTLQAPPPPIDPVPPIDKTQAQAQPQEADSAVRDSWHTDMRRGSERVGVGVVGGDAPSARLSHDLTSWMGDGLQVDAAVIREEKVEAAVPLAEEVRETPVAPVGGEGQAAGGKGGKRARLATKLTHEHIDEPKVAQDTHAQVRAQGQGEAREGGRKKGGGVLSAECSRCWLMVCPTPLTPSLDSTVESPSVLPFFAQELEAVWSSLVSSYMPLIEATWAKGRALWSQLGVERETMALLLERGLPILACLLCIALIGVRTTQLYGGCVLCGGVLTRVCVWWGLDMCLLVV